MDPHSIAQQELLPGERLVWAGRPDPAALARTRWPTAAVGVILTLCALVWLRVVFQLPFSVAGGALLASALIVPAIGVVMLGIGLAMLASPVWYARKAKSMTYGVTDARIMIIGPRGVQSFEPGDIQQLDRTDWYDGRGDLIFRDEHVNSVLPMNTFDVIVNRKIGFFGVSDVRAAEDAVRRLKRRSA